MQQSYQQSSQELARLHSVKQMRLPKGVPLGPEMIGFFKNSVQKRQDKLVKIAASWELLVPSTLNDHCALESLVRGVLTVIMDSSSHQYELKQLLLAGVEQQLLMACKNTGLRKVALKRGRWYEGGDDARKIRFD